MKRLVVALLSVGVLWWPGSATAQVAFNPDFSLQMGLKAVEAKDYVSARMAFTDVVRLAPDSVSAATAHLKLGYLNLRDGNAAAAGEEWQAVVRSYTGSQPAAEAALRLGHLCLRNNDAAGAFEWFATGASKVGGEPAMVQTCTMQAGFACVSQYWKDRKLDHLLDAMKWFKAVKIEAVDGNTGARTRIGLGETFLLYGLPAQALGAYKEADSLKPDLPYLQGLARYGKACSLYSMGDYQAADTAFQDLLAWVPGSTPKEKNGRWRNARPGFVELKEANSQKAMQLSGLDIVPSAQYWRAMTLYKMGQKSDAVALAKQVLTDFPDLSTGYRVRKFVDEATKAIEAEGK